MLNMSENGLNSLKCSEKHKEKAIEKVLMADIDRMRIYIQVRIQVNPYPGSGLTNSNQNPDLCLYMNLG